ncbi:MULTISPECIES: hypothetical protein [Bacteroides]|uniref:hypothetical protein n=1 Tax=Bacteroides TaxID=816 RepID=UPI001441331B|nr:MULTISPECIES: hypothetical protein [Bacteroides]
MAQQSPNFLIIQCDHLIQRVVGAYDAAPKHLLHVAFYGTDTTSNQCTFYKAEHINLPLPDSISP